MLANSDEIHCPCCWGYQPTLLTRQHIFVNTCSSTHNAACDVCGIFKPRKGHDSLNNGSTISSIPTMTEQEVEEVKPICETRGQQTEDEAAVKQSRWDALLLAATGEM